jgi:hypothetical protein
MPQISFSNLSAHVVESGQEMLVALRNPRKLLENIDELTLARKIEIVVVAAVLIAIAVVIYQNWGYWGGAQDGGGGGSGPLQIWSLPAKGVDPTLPVSATNPAVSASPGDTAISGAEGRLELTEIEAGRRGGVRFYPGPAAKDWPDQFQRLGRQSDPTRWTVSLLAAGILEHRGWAFPAAAGLTAEQRRTETLARKALLDDVALLETGALDGTFDTAMNQQVFASLQALTSLPPGDTAGRQSAARKVMRLGRQFLEHVEDQKAQAIATYVDAVLAVLDDSQRQKLAELARDLAAGKPLPAVAATSAPARNAVTPDVTGAGS